MSLTGFALGSVSGGSGHMSHTLPAPDGPELRLHGPARLGTIYGPCPGMAQGGGVACSADPTPARTGIMFSVV